MRAWCICNFFSKLWWNYGVSCTACLHGGVCGWMYVKNAPQRHVLNTTPLIFFSYIFRDVLYVQRFATTCRTLTFWIFFTLRFTHLTKRRNRGVHARTRAEVSLSLSLSLEKWKNHECQVVRACSDDDDDRNTRENHGRNTYNRHNVTREW